MALMLALNLVSMISGMARDLLTFDQATITFDNATYTWNEITIDDI